MKSTVHLCGLSLAMVLAASPARAADVVVRVTPSDSTVFVNDVFTVDIVADLSVPVLGWGLDFSIDDPSIVSMIGSPQLASPPWAGVLAPDGDGLVGLANPAGSSISGSVTPLASLTLQALQVGETDLRLAVTAGDLTEGFAMDPTGFATVSFVSAHVSVIVPEPRSWVLLLLGGLAVWARSVRYRRSPTSM
ncbi:MAG: cohesin domain-containing protein [Planctomycetota bacterium]|nr:cohesin domain-containing protein [Planctomycetota bacterium]